MNKEFIKRYERYEQDYPGITEQIWKDARLNLPRCIRCGSGDMAEVQIGVVARTIRKIIYRQGHKGRKEKQSLLSFNLYVAKNTNYDYNNYD